MKRLKFAAAITMLEVLLAMISLAIIAIGALSYEYHVAIHTRIARAQIDGTRIAQLLLEEWKSTGGSVEYDASTLGLGFSSGLPIPSEWSEDDELGSPLHDSACAVKTGRYPMLVTLRWNDIDHDDIAQVILRQLSVVVRFGEIDSEGHLVYPSSHLDKIRPVIMTTYTRLDASGG